MISIPNKCVWFQTSVFCYFLHIALHQTALTVTEIGMDVWPQKMGMCLCGDNHCHVYASTRKPMSMLTLSHSAVCLATRQTQNICITFTHLHICINVIQMFCVCWAAVRRDVSTNVVFMLGQRLRCWPNDKTTML